jgi:hypothetical protein
MVHEWQIEKDLEGGGHGLMEVWAWHLPEGTKENDETPQSA